MQVLYFVLYLYLVPRYFVLEDTRWWRVGWCEGYTSTVRSTVPPYGGTSVKCRRTGYKQKGHLLVRFTSTGTSTRSSHRHNTSTCEQKGAATGDPMSKCPPFTSKGARGSYVMHKLPQVSNGTLACREEEKPARHRTSSSCVVALRSSERDR